ncbi:hypothetical protein KIM372_16250 [Bombiscardovia nodaiensis]|uniref:ABC transporter domain-containing protein n=1 Tax=Bombiscardovia nodaiensis TaxID=2932181 RepID=A0ABM8B9Z3_9BIFI|nr:hypothetical protein KIM372_16250 [Bombiscardovia nodaiensis]
MMGMGCGNMGRGWYARSMITIEHLTKTFGAKKAINDVSFTAADGKVTGFLGPNGAGKSTTMRAALGLIRPESGQALIDGHPFTSLRSPMTEVGSVLNPRSAHKNRTARAHLEALAFTNGIPQQRVDEVMSIAGIASVAKKKAGSFSLGMSQRLSIAAALLGDPQNLVFDEPVNGLDPEGVMWVRQLCRFYASQGRCVLLSSHLMSEVAQTADDLVIIGQGRVLERTSVANFLAEHSSHAIRIATPEAARLQPILQAVQGVNVELLPPSADDPAGAQVLRVAGMELAQVAQMAAANQIVIYEFREEKASLEEAYMALTHGMEEYKTAAVPGQGPAPVQAAPAAPVSPMASPGQPGSGDYQNFQGGQPQTAAFGQPMPGQQPQQGNQQPGQPPYAQAQYVQPGSQQPMPQQSSADQPAAAYQPGSYTQPPVFTQTPAGQQTSAQAVPGQYQMPPVGVPDNAGNAGSTSTGSAGQPEEVRGAATPGSSNQEEGGAQ